MEIELLSPTASGLFPEGARAQQVAAGFRFTEGPLWDPATRTLLFSDIPANRIYRWSETAGAQVYREPSGKSNGLTWSLKGDLLACEHLTRRVSREAPGGALLPLAEAFGGKRLNSPNDLVCHSSGRIYFSDPPYGIQSESVGALAEQEQPLNGLYVIPAAGGAPVLVGDDFDRPNGLAFSPDERLLYVNDTPRYHVRDFDVADDGTLSAGRVLVELSAAEGEGRPDGLKIDQLGNLYTTGPGGLWVVSPAGEILARLRLPEKSANCAWGDDGQSLYITASTSVYRIRTSIPGVWPAGHAARAASR
jgi:gluconolactonase